MMNEVFYHALRAMITFCKCYLSNKTSLLQGWQIFKTPPAILWSVFVPLPIITYHLLCLCLLSRGAMAGKGTLREALSNNDQPDDLYTVTLNFHTQSKAAASNGRRRVEGAEAREVGRGAPARAGNAIYKNSSSLFCIFHK